jgi:hypothetical protein
VVEEEACVFFNSTEKGVILHVYFISLLTDSFKSKTSLTGLHV